MITGLQIDDIWTTDEDTIMREATSYFKRISSILGCQHTKKMDKYMGFRILSSRVKNEDFPYILNHLHSRLVGWKEKTLSWFGRVTLLKLVLNLIPIYSMKKFWIPHGICDAIDRISRSFIWGNDHHHWVG
ncbi:hypothetical protein AAZX31_16G065700 [Glycine max]